MYCANCDKDIPVGENYYKLKIEDNCFCCTECITDYLYYRNMISIETNEGDQDTE